MNAERLQVCAQANILIAGDSSLFALSRLAADLEGPLFGDLALSPTALLALATLPLLAAGLTALTARRTVLYELSRLP